MHWKAAKERILNSRQPAENFLLCHLDLTIPIMLVGNISNHSLLLYMSVSIEGSIISKTIPIPVRFTKGVISVVPFRLSDLISRDLPPVKLIRNRTSATPEFQLHISGLMSRLQTHR